MGNQLYALQADFYITSLNSQSNFNSLHRERYKLSDPPGLKTAPSHSLLGQREKNSDLEHLCAFTILYCSIILVEFYFFLTSKKTNKQLSLEQMWLCYRCFWSLASKFKYLFYKTVRKLQYLFDGMLLNGTDKKHP